MKHASARQQRGISFVEVAIASVILSACAVLLWGVIDRQAKVTRSDQSVTLVDRVHDAILAYGHAHGRLPCPAPLTTGTELCDGAASGFLPYLTLGLPEPSAGRVRYKVSMVAPSPVVGSPYRVVVAQQPDKVANLSAAVVPLAVLAPNAHEALFDLCQALASPTVSREMAYALTIDTGSAQPTASGSVAPTSTEGMEQTVGRAQLAAKLHCASLAMAGRAQFNAALAAATMARAMSDVYAQFKLMKFTYAADTAQGVYFLSNSIYSLDRAVTKKMAATAAMQASDGVDTKALTLAQINMVKVGAYTAAMASNLARFVKNEITAEVREEQLKQMVATTGTTAADIKARALLGGSSAFFLEDKWSKPAP